MRVPPLPYVAAATIGAAYGVLDCGVWALAFVLPAVVEVARNHALEAEKLRTETELARLRSQLEPHFLLNTLNMIAGLVTRDPREARRLLGCLGELLTDVARSGEAHTLAQELGWLKRYAFILETRHVGALTFRWAVDESLGDAVVPYLLLQPLVENAVQHGALRAKGGTGEVSVSVSVVYDGPQKEPWIVCEVRDNGPGLEEKPVREGALGLHAVRRRLELRDDGSDLRITTSSRGTSATVRMPLGSVRGARAA
jgi:LytS/YehU family sensor histidine kinase